MNTANLFQHHLFTHRDFIFCQGQKGLAYRVTEGIVALECGDESASTSLVHLAMPGDLIGIEGLFDQAYSMAARALFPCRLVSVIQDKRFIKSHILPEVCIQQQRQSLDMVKLRTGKVSQRLAYLLHMFSAMQANRKTPLTRKELPSLKYVSQIVDVRIETICRELNSLMPDEEAERARNFVKLRQFGPRDESSMLFAA